MKVPIIVDASVPGSFYSTQSRSETCPIPPAGKSQDLLALPLLVDAFVEGALVDEQQDMGKRKRKGQLHFLATVFANLSTVWIHTCRCL
jgi:hypothetical protein